MEKNRISEVSFLDIYMRISSLYDFFKYQERFVLNICPSFLHIYFYMCKSEIRYGVNLFALLHCEYRVGILTVVS